MSGRVVQRFYVMARYIDGGTLRGNGWVEVVAADETEAVAKAAAYPWPGGCELGAALEPDAFKVARWVAL